MTNLSEVLGNIVRKARNEALPCLRYYYGAWRNSASLTRLSQKGNVKLERRLHEFRSQGLLTDKEAEAMAGRLQSRRSMLKIPSLGFAAIVASAAISSAQAAPYAANGAFLRGKGAGVTGYDSSFDVNIKVADRTALAALSTNFKTAYLSEDLREGVFKWSSANLSTAVTLDTAQGLYVAPSSDPTGASGAWVRVLDQPQTANPTWFGVKGDGSDDLVGWNAAVAMLNSGFLSRLSVPPIHSNVSDAINPVVGADWAIIGDGYGVPEITRTGGTSGTILQLGTSTQGSLRWVISGIRLENSNNPTSGASLFCMNSDNGLLNNVWCAAGYIGMQLGDTASGTASQAVTAINCRFIPQAVLGGRCLEIQSQSGFKIINSVCSAGVVQADANFIGVHVNPGVGSVMDTMYINNCTFNFGQSNPKYIVKLNATVHSIGTFLAVNTINDQAQDGACIYAETAIVGGEPTGVDAQFVNCTANANLNSASIMLKPVSGSYCSFQWIGGNLSGNGASIIDIAGATVDVLIDGVGLLNRSISDSPAAIIIRNAVSGVQITNNFVLTRDRGDGEPFTPFSSLITFTGTVGNVVVVGNNARRVSTRLIQTWPTSVDDAQDFVVQSNISPDDVLTRSDARAAGATIAMSDGNSFNIAQVDLEPGIWIIGGQAAYDISAAANFTVLQAGINSVSATLPSPANINGSRCSYVKAAGSTGSPLDTIMTLNACTLALTATTTIYLVLSASFSSGSVGGYGYILARRVS